MMRCARCGGSFFPDDDDELACLNCGARLYHLRGLFFARLIDYMGSQAEKQRRKAERAS